MSTGAFFNAMKMYLNIKLTFLLTGEFDVFFQLTTGLFRGLLIVIKKSHCLNLFFKVWKQYVEQEETFYVSDYEEILLFGKVILEWNWCL